MRTHITRLEVQLGCAVVITAFAGTVVAQVRGTQAAPAGQCTASATWTNPLNGPQWNGWGNGLANTRSQSAEGAGLSASDVPRLRLKWAFGFPNSTWSGSQPTVVGGRIFVGSQPGTVYALDARSGCIHWTFQAKAGVRNAVTIGPRRGGATGHVAYFGDLTGRAYAVDAATGEQLWSTQVDDHSQARLTGAPTLYEDLLYVPVSSLEEMQGMNPKYECCSFRGSVAALDAASGRIVWKTYTIAEKATPRGKNAAGVAMWGPSGASIWSAPTIDPARRVLYVGTGNTYTPPQQTTSNAVMALDLRSGVVKWVSQVTPKDVWVYDCKQGDPQPCSKDVGPDHDFGSSPMLTRLPTGRDLIVIGQKSGMTWALDPENQGKVVWQYRAGEGGVHGGVQWGGAVDGEHAFFAISDLLKSSPGGLHALRLDTGRRAWLTPAPAAPCGSGPGCSAAQSAAISVIPGAVFSGSFDGVMRAYAVGDGKIIWEFDTNRPFDTVNGVRATGASIGGPGPTIAGGMLYFNSGGGAFVARSGNVLLAFGVE